MNNVPENELFSAYLDGELTADEQARVEQLLATSPEARQLLESLKTLSATVQSLPVHKLDEDLSQRVLRLAERRMLSEPPTAPRGADGRTRSESGPSTLPAPPDARASAHDTLAPDDFRWHFSLRRLLRPRNLVFPAAAVAIALLIAVTERFGEDRPAGRHVAMAPSAASPEAERAADRDRGPAEQPVMGPMKREVRSDAANVAVADPYANRSAGETVPADGKPGGQPLSSSPAITNAPLNAAPPAEAKAPATGMAGMPGMMAPAAPPAQAEEESVARRSNLPLAGRDMKSAPEEPAPKKLELKKAPADMPGYVAAVPAIVVRCNVTDSTAARGLLEQVLNKRQVALKDSDDRLQTITGGGAGKGAMDAQQFVVEISPVELQKALGELKTHSHLFASYSLEPQAAPAPTAFGSATPKRLKKQGAFGYESPAAPKKLSAVASDSVEDPTRSRTTTLRSPRQDAQTSSEAAGAMQERLSRGTPQAPIVSHRAQRVTPSQQMPEVTSQTGRGQAADLSQSEGQSAPVGRGAKADARSEAKADKASPGLEQAAKEKQESLAMQILPDQVKQRVVFVLSVTVPEANRLAGPEKAKAAEKVEAATKVAEPAKPAAASPPPAAAAPASRPSPK